MFGCLLTRRMTSSSISSMKQLPIKLVVENGKIKDIKILQDLVGKELTNIKSFSETYYLNSSMIQEKIQQQINKNMPLL
jgi:hypothetical protein